MNESILVSIKKLLGVAENDQNFDTDIIMHINSAFSTLHQLGVGPKDAFMISDSTSTWDEFISNDNRINSVKTYVFLKVKMLFDPPSSSFVLESMKETAKELEWRLNVASETEEGAEDGL